MRGNGGAAFDITDSHEAVAFTPQSSAIEAIVQICGISVVLLGLAGLFGWLVGVEFLTTVLRGRAPIAPTTAFTFMLAGAAILFRSHRLLRVGCALTVILLGALALAQRITDVDFGIDYLFVPQSTMTTLQKPGHMALSSAAAFMLLGGALLGFNTSRATLRRVNETIAIFIGAIALLALIGYSYGTEEFYSLSGFGSMALHAAIAFALLALGILCTRSDGLAGVFANSGPGADAARRLLPFAIFVPFTLGWIVLWAKDAELLTTAQAVSAFCASVILVITGSVWWNGLALDKSDIYRRRAEAKAASLAAIVNSSADAILAEDLQGMITSWNFGAEQTFGYHASEIVGNPVSILVPEVGRSAAALLLAQIGRGESVQNFEIGLLRKDGSTVETSVTLSPIRDSKGRIVGASKVMHDISDRKALQDHLLYSEQLHRIAFDQSPMGMVYLGLDGRFNKVNHRLCEITGYDTEELLGMTVSDISHPDDLARDSELLNRFLHGGEDTFETETRYLCKDGSMRWVAVTARMISDKDGRAQYSVVLIRDIQDKITSDNILRDKEERYRALVEASSTVVWQTTPDGALVFAGDRWAAITGQSDEEKQGWGWLDAIHPDDRAPTTELWLHSLATRTLHENEFRVRTRTGDYRWFAVRGVPILKIDGSVREWVGANTDIHDEKLAAKERALLASLVESTDDGLFGQDAKGLITSWNRGAEKIFGYRADEVIGSSIMRLVPTSAQSFEREIQRKIVAGEQVGNFEAVRRAKNGRQFPASITISPLKDRAGKVVGASKVLRDITDRKLAEDALRQSEWRLAGILRQSPAGIIQADAAGRMTLVNRRWCEMLGYAEDELLGRSTVEVTHSSSRDATLETVRALREGAESAQLEKLFLRKDGSILTAQSNVTAMRSPQGEFLGLIAVIMDISDRKKFELELQIAKTEAETANLAKSDFLSNMSHELRSPLNAILGFAQLIDTSSPPPTNSQKRAVEQILKAGWFLLKMINEILDLAQIEAGKLPVRMEAVSVGDIINECKDMVEAQAQSRDIRMTFKRPNLPTYVYADRTRLTQVLINLLTNAIKYNKLGGTIVIDCQLSTQGRVRVSVKDSGDGLKPEEVTQLFERFNRLGRETGDEEGTGIGLVMSKKLIELMKGDIGVESAKGEGSVFWVELPLAEAPSSAPAMIESSAVVQASILVAGPMRTVLYVEDNAANLMLVADCIERRHDIHLMSAPDGPTGVRVALNSKPDVILMDINLPGINGLEAMRMLSQYPATKHIPVIALSANAMPRDVELYLAAGFFRYLAKPINIIELMETLNSALVSSRGR